MTVHLFVDKGCRIGDSKPGERRGSSAGYQTLPGAEADGQSYSSNNCTAGILRVYVAVTVYGE